MTEISRSAQVARLGTDVVSVKDFGAKGDGVTDDAAAIQAAYSHVAALGGGFVDFPEGTYCHGENLTFGDGSAAASSTSQNVYLRGVGGSGSAGSLSPDTEGAVVLKRIGQASTGAGIVWEGPMIGGMLNIDIDSNLLVNTALLVSHVYSSNFKNINVRNYNDIGILQTAYNTPTGTYIGANDNVWENVKSEAYHTSDPRSCWVIGSIDGYPNDLDVARNTYISCTTLCSNHVDSSGFVLRFCDVLTFKGCFSYTFNGSNAAPLRVLAPANVPVFPSEIVLDNSALIGTIVTSSNWEPAGFLNRRGIVFWPYNVADTETQSIPVPTNKGIHGYTTDGRFFGTNQIVLHDEQQPALSQVMRYAPTVLYRDFDVSLVTNTTSVSELAQFSVPADTLSVASNRHDRALKVTASGFLRNNTGGSETAFVQLFYGGTAAFSATIPLNNNTNFIPWLFECEINARNNNSSQQNASGFIKVGDGSTHSSVATPIGVEMIQNNDGMTVDSSVAQYLRLVVTLSSASNDLRISSESFDVELI